MWKIKNYNSIFWKLKKRKTNWNYFKWKYFYLDNMKNKHISTKRNRKLLILSIAENKCTRKRNIQRERESWWGFHRSGRLKFGFISSYSQQFKRNYIPYGAETHIVKRKGNTLCTRKFSFFQTINFALRISLFLSFHFENANQTHLFPLTALCCLLSILFTLDGQNAPSYFLK